MMTEQETAQRSLVVEIARSWINTPYRHAQGLKGAGVDCAYLLIEVYHEAGLIPRIDPGPYPRDWNFHRDDERYLQWIEQFADLTFGLTAPLPGDVATFKFGRTYAHGGIVTEWPRLVHAYYKYGSVTESDLSEMPGLRNRLGPVYRYRGWEV